jgi:hypothetical protein
MRLRLVVAVPSLWTEFLLVEILIVDVEIIVCYILPDMEIYDFRPAQLSWFSPLFF